MISTQEEHHQKVKSFSAGANFYIAKPVSPAKLIQHVKLLIG